MDAVGGQVEPLQCRQLEQAAVNLGDLVAPVQFAGESHTQTYTHTGTEALHTRLSATLLQPGTKKPHGTTAQRTGLQTDWR